MKIFIIKVFILFIRILYAPMKLRKTQNKIVWLSRQSNIKSEDMRMLSEAIASASPDTQQVFRLRYLKEQNELTLSYIFSVFRDMWELASAKIAVTDSYIIPISCLNHKSDLKVIQIWHALGAVKKFGLQSTGMVQGRDVAVSKAMYMHKNYDCVIAPSEKAAEFYCEAFDCTQDNIKIASLPRVDVILDGISRKEEFIEKNPGYKNKKIIVYVATFRDDDDVFAEELYNAFEKYKEFGLIICAHPLSETAQNPKYKCKGKFSTYDYIKMADGVISDYSACAIEASVLEKPLWLFTPDYDKYKSERGLNIDVLKEADGFCYKNAEELIEAVKSDNYDYDKLVAFSEKYVENRKPGCTKQLAEIICSYLK